MNKECDGACPGNELGDCSHELQRDLDDMTVQIEVAHGHIAELRAQLKAEQNANRKVVEKLCKAMGRWEGPWDNAAVERLSGTVTQDMIDAGVAALDHDPAISDESRVRLVLQAALMERRK